MRVCFDLDGTLCVGTPYEQAEPLSYVSPMLSQLRAAGHVVIIHTARGMGRTSGNVGLAQAAIARLTLNQLEAWGFEYDEIYFGKPSADFYIDDKAVDADHMMEVVDAILGDGPDEQSRPIGSSAKT